MRPWKGFFSISFVLPGQFSGIPAFRFSLHSAAIGRYFFMKKDTKVFVYILLGLVAIFIVTTIYEAITRHQLNKESKAFVDVAVPAIVADWDATEVQKRAGPEYNATVDYEALQQFFDVLRGLGDVKEYRGASGGSKIVFSHQNGIELIAAYEASVEFEAGSAEIQISVIKHNDVWQIYRLTIDPIDPDEKKDVI
jgi:hypothetical protein